MLDQLLDVPDVRREAFGCNTLFRLHLFNNAGAPVTPLLVEGIINLETTPYAPAVSRKVFLNEQDEQATGIGTDYSYHGILYIKSTYAAEFISRVLNVNWSVNGSAAISLQFPDRSSAILEAVFRGMDVKDHLFSQVFMDIVLDNVNFSSPPAEEIVKIPFHSSHAPNLLCSGAQVILEAFDGDGIGTTLSLSSAPLNIAYNQIIPEYTRDYDALFYIKVVAQDSEWFITDAGVQGQTIILPEPVATGERVFIAYTALVENNPVT